MGDIQFREAKPQDLSAIVALLQDDTLGKAREALENLDVYEAAFSRILKDPNAYLIVGLHGTIIVACIQVNIIACLSHRAATRGQIENVRMHADYRNQGFGRRLVEHAIQICRSQGCRIIQLMSDKQRHQAIHFYESYGFQASHEGLKLFLPDTKSDNSAKT